MPRIVRILAVVCLIASTGCKRSPSSPTLPITTAPNAALPSATTLPRPVLPVSQGRPVVMIYRDGSAAGPDLGLAIWDDGRAVWRDSTGKILQSRIEPKPIDDLLQYLHGEGLFGNGTGSYDAYGPDSVFDVIEVTLPDRRLHLASWHEAAESNASLVATADGLEALNGRVRSSVLAAQPADYLRFRQTWSTLRAMTTAWLPKTGDPFVGTISLDDGRPLR